MKTISKIVYLVVTWALVFAFGYAFSQQANKYPDSFNTTTDRHIAVLQKALDRIPTIKEIQRRIGAKEDGVIGPNTISLWKKAVNNQYASEAMERMAEDTK